MTQLNILAQLTVILILGVLSKIVSKKTKIPFPILLLGLGILFSSYRVLDLDSLGDIPNMTRTIALIFIVFSIGFYLKFNELIKLSQPILLLSTIGVFSTALLIGGLSYWFLGLPLLSAALFGTLLAGTDVAALADYKVQNKTLTILKVESMINNALTIVMPLLLLDFIRAINQPAENILLVETITENAIQFVSIIIVGILIGFFGFKIGRYVLKHSGKIHLETIGLSLALAVYVIAEFINGSGIVAVAVTTIMLSKSRLPEKKFLRKFYDDIAFILTIFIFILLGTEFTVKDLAIITRTEIIAIILLLIVSRLLTVFISLRKTKLSLKNKIYLGLIAPKGNTAAALAPLILSPIYGIPEAKKLVVLTFIAIIISFIISLIILNIIYPEKDEKK